MGLRKIRSGTLGVLVLPLLALGCGNVITTGITGTTGVARDGAGSAELRLAVCSGSVDSVMLYGPHRGEETTPQEPIGVWKATRRVSREAVLDFAEPGSGWTVVTDPGPLENSTEYTAYGFPGDADAQLAQVSFTLTSLEALPSGRVRYGEGGQDQSALAAFHDDVC